MKSKLVKRGLAFLLAMAMICTSNAFSTDLMLVKAAEADEIAEGMEDYADETESPADVDDENDAGSKEDVNTVTDSGNDKEGGANTENGNTDTDNGNSDADSGNTDTGNGNSDAENGNTDTENGNTATDDGNADTEIGDPNENGENTDVNDGNPVDDEEAADEGETEEGEADESLEAFAPSYNNGNEQNYYRGFAFKSEDELSSVRKDMGLVDSSEHEWKDAATIEALMEALNEELDDNVAYAYIAQTDPNFAYHTITIPAGIKGIIISNGWYDPDGDGEEEGQDFGVIADTLEIEGPDTAVYFQNTLINTTAGTFTIEFPSTVNTSKVTFRDSNVRGTVKCDSTAGTIAFEGDTVLNGYENSSLTEFHEFIFKNKDNDEDEDEVRDAKLLIANASSGLVFNEIAGDTNVIIVYNGYPDNLDFLPRFNKAFDLGKDKDEANQEYDRNIGIRFLAKSENPFDGDWWWSQEERFSAGTQMAYFAGDTWNEKDLIGRRVGYCSEPNKDENEEELRKFYIDSRTGKLQKDGEESEESAYRVLKLDAKEFAAVKADTELLWRNGNNDENSEGGEGGGDSGQGYEDRWEEIDTGMLDSFLGKSGVAYVAIEAKKKSHDEESKTLALPANLQGVLLFSEWENEVRVPWQLNSLSTGGTEVVINCAIDPMGQEFSITAAENATVTFRDSEVKGAVKNTSTAGTIAFEGDTILNGYENSSLTEFPKYIFKNDGNDEVRDAKLLIANASSGLVFDEIAGDTDVSIVYNGYPGDSAFLPRFHGKIDLGKGKNEEDKEYDRGINIRFLTESPNPFEGDWGNTQDEALEKGTQIAYFARERIGRKVHCDVNDLHINPITGKLEADGEVWECAYRVLELNAKEFAAVKADTELLWRNGDNGENSEGDEGGADSGDSGQGYGDRWEAVDTGMLDAFLGMSSVEYVVIQATKKSHDDENKTLALPANLQGALFVSDWDDAANASVPWQLNSLSTGGTEVVINCTIDPMGQEFSITAEENAKVTFRDSEVKGAVKNTSTAGTIAFEGDTILNGYENSSLTEFPEYIFKNNGKDEVRNAKLFIAEASSGLTFGEIAGDTDVFIVYNGYPGDPAFLPRFHGKIDLGKVTNEDPQEGEDSEYDRNIGIRFLPESPNPFEGDDWWETEDEALKKGTQIAYFARERIGRRVGYIVIGRENNLHINPSTGKLEEDGAVWECAYSVLELDAKEFAAVKADTGLLWGNGDSGQGFRDRWEAVDTGMLDTFLGMSSVEYIVIQATKKSHDDENKTLALPANLKGALLVSDWDDAAKASVPWQLNSLSTGGAEVVINCAIDPGSQKLSLTAKTANTAITLINSEILGDVNISKNAAVTFRDSDIRGSIDSASDIEITGMLITNGLTGCPKLTVNGNATIIVRDPEALIFNDIELIGFFDIVYNGYPTDAAKLPVFNRAINSPDDKGVGIRFIERSEKDFWDENDWWDKAPDEILTAGKLAAHSGMDKAATKTLLNKVWYNTLNEKYRETTKLTAIVDDDGKSKLVIAELNSDGKTIVNFDLKKKDKIYDGASFGVEKDVITNNAGYEGTVDCVWKKAGTPVTPLKTAPKDAGAYVVTLSVPEDTEDFVGSTDIEVTISPRPVTVRVIPNAAETTGDHVKYEVKWDGFIGDDTYSEQAKVVESEEQTDKEGKFYTLVTTGGAVGANYVIKHADPVRIKITEATPDDPDDPDKPDNPDKPDKPDDPDKPDKPDDPDDPDKPDDPDDARPLINSVLFPKKKDAYTAVYTGEQIRPVMVVAYKYKDEKGNEKTQSLKLNVDYTLTYSNNVDVTNTAKVTVRGIGGYTGKITREFSITQKSIKKVTLSAVGDIVYGSKPTVVVMDGTYELKEGKDYELVDGNGVAVDDWSKKGSETSDTPSVLKVKGIGNYKDVSSKSAKFNILKSNTEIKSIAANTVTVEFKKLPAKGYTYNGKAQKPAVVVKDGGVKVPSSQFKVIYTNNVNAGTDTAKVQVVGVSKKGKGYYGIAKQELTFSIKQKDFGKVSVSSVAVIPKIGKLNTITMTVKDGKRILTEGEDYTVDYSKIRKPDGSIQDSIEIGKKYDVTLKPIEGGNYTKDSKKIVKVKFGQLNLASKTAKVSVKITDADNNKVEVRYNGSLLVQDTDYTATVKKEKGKSTYTVQISAKKGRPYKGKKTIKGVEPEVKK